MSKYTVVALLAASLIVAGLFMFNSKAQPALELDRVYSHDEVLGDRYSPLVVVIEYDVRDESIKSVARELHNQYGDDVAIVLREYPYRLWDKLSEITLSAVHIQGKEYNADQDPIEQIIDSTMTEIEARKGGEKTHQHADIKIYINRKQLDLSADKYQSTPENPLHADIHLHDGNGEMIHLHWTGVTISRFFYSLGMNLTNDCLILDDGSEHCSGAEGNLSVYANEQEVDPTTYLVEDLDRLLVSYGDTADIPTQLSAVQDEACMYSLICPERGTPPTESCVGDVNSSCGG